MISDTLLSKFWHGSGFDSGVPISERDISIVPAPGGRWGIVHGLRVKPFDAYPSKDDAVVKGRELARESRGFLFILNGEARLESTEDFSKSESGGQP